MNHTAEELWDEYSTYIDSNIDSFSQVAGSSIITKHDFMKAFDEFQEHSIQKVLVNMMREDPVKFVQYALLVIGKDIYESNAKDFTFSCDANVAEGQRFNIKVKGTIKPVNKTNKP